MVQGSVVWDFDNLRCGCDLNGETAQITRVYNNIRGPAIAVDFWWFWEFRIIPGPSEERD